MANRSLRLGGESELLELVTVTGNQAGLLPSTRAAVPAMSAAVSASTLTSSVLGAARRGSEPAPVVVDAEHVAVAARSERYARDSGRGVRGSVCCAFAVLAHRRWLASSARQLPLAQGARARRPWMPGDI